MKRSLIALFALFTVFCLLMPQSLSFAEETADAINIEHLFYDDRVDLSGKEVEIIDAGTPTSYQVGYGIETNTILDTAVVTLKGDTLFATGIGKATVMIDSVTFEVTVSPAPISLLFLIGQSNMRGSEGNADQSIVCPDGMVYSSHGDDRGTANPVMTLANARSFAASALAGKYCSINVDGTTDCVSGYPLHNLTDAGTGKIGLDSGLGYEWVKQTGEKVWLVNAAVGGTKIASWQPGASCYMKAAALFSACQETLQDEISAGHYTLSHMGYFWCQGCSDNDGRTAEWYVNMFLTMHEGLKNDLAFDHDGNAATEDVTFEFAGIIPVRAGHAHFTGYRDGTSKDTTTAKYYESFLDLRFTGPRVAQYWLANNSDLPDVWNVCTIGDNWVWMPDGTNGVTAYFQEHYEGGTVDYTTQVKQSASWYTPTTPKAVHDSIHYNQIGYNELGRESARNALIILGEIETPNTDTTVKLLGWDGYTEIDDITAATTGASDTLVVPVVSPVWESKSFTYTLSDGLEWNYYDLLATDTQKDGTLKIGGQTVTVHQDIYHIHLAQLPESICCGLNLWNELEHDAQYFADGTGWSVHDSGNVYSVTIPVNAGDAIYATSFCAAGTNGNSSIDGIGITFFGEYSVVKALTPAEVYSEFVANDGYLAVPSGTVAVNIPMWSNSDDNELYLLNLEHVIAESTQTAAPTCTEEGLTTQTCGICSNTYSEAIPALGHTEETLPAVAPTCTETGLTAGVKCSVCDGILTAQTEVAALGHSYDDGVETTAPSCTAEGVMTFTCTVCGNAFTEVIAATGHNYVPVITDSTCTGVGYTTYTCSACGDSYTSDETPAAGHSYDDGVIATAPTCMAEGVKTFTCSACGITYTESVPATGHTQEIIPAVAPTCTTTGLTEGTKCSVCGEILTAQTAVAALGHSYNSGVETTAPSCTAEGVKTFTCVGCGNSYTEAIPALGHTGTILPAVAPTCTTVGQTEGVHCSTCGTVFTPQGILPALGHTEGEPMITVEPTAHTPGIRSVFCATCGELLQSESITLTGSLYISGDADDNGCVDIYDALLVMQYSAGWDVNPNSLNADVSKDGIVGLYDAVMILQYCTGTSFDSALRTLLEKADELSIDVMTILEHPQNQYTIEGQQAVFKLSAAGEGLQYQWYINRGSGDGWRPIAGATSDTYTISATQMIDDGCRYRCGITDASGRQIMSNTATLYVDAAVNLPQTGDQANLLLWTTMMAISLCCLIGLVVAGKRYSMTK